MGLDDTPTPSWLQRVAAVTFVTIVGLLTLSGLIIAVATRDASTLTPSARDISAAAAPFGSPLCVSSTHPRGERPWVWNRMPESLLDDGPGAHVVCERPRVPPGTRAPFG